MIFNYLHILSQDSQSAILHEVRQVKKAAFRPGTRQNLKTQLRYTYYSVHIMISTLFHVIVKRFVLMCFLSHSLVSTASVKNYLSGLKTWSRLLGHDMSAFENYDIRSTLQGITKISNHTPK